MKYILMAILIITQTACATGVNILASIYDKQDPCQSINQPSWCGASSGKAYVTRDFRTNRAILTTKVE